MEITGSYDNYVVQSSTMDSIKKDKTEKKLESAKNSNSESITEYVSKLEKLAPSVEFKVGNTFSNTKNGKTLTINPRLLKKMQNDPEQEKETKELIKGVETMTKYLDSFYKATGRTLVYRNSYIDENGKYRSCAYTKKEDKLSPKLRKERQESIEKLAKKTKEKIAKKKEELEEILEEKKEGKAEKFLEEKIASSENGMVYLYNTDIKTIISIAEEESQTKENIQIGTNLDFQI